LANEINVTFPANLSVEASVGDFTIRTDQPEKSGGDNSAPSPSALFTTSVATCTGYFALKFCRARKIDTTGMRLTMQYDWDKELKRYPKMSIQLELPDGFPEKYRGAIIKAMDQCAVKRSILQPPEFEMTLI